MEILLGRCPTRANFNLTPILRPIEKEEKSWKLFYFVFDRNAWNEDCTHAGKAGRGHLPPRENLKCLQKWWILDTTSVPPPQRHYPMTTMCHPGWSVENKFSGSFYFIFVVSTYKCAADQRGPLKCSLTLPCFRTVVQCPPQTGLNELCFGQRLAQKIRPQLVFFAKMPEHSATFSRFLKERFLNF